MITLREIIKTKGLTNKEVADSLGISETNIKRYDDLSKRTISEVIKIADILKMSTEELIGVSISINKEEEQPTYESRLLSIIESQQRTIENLTKK